MWNGALKDRENNSNREKRKSVHGMLCYKTNMYIQ